MRILLVKTSSLGDVVHNLPMVSDMVRARPGLAIDWLVEPAFADIPAMHPAVGSVVVADLRHWLRSPWDRGTWRGVRALRARLAETAYDLILDTQGLVKSALVARLARGPLYGPDRRSAREPLAAAFYAHGLPMDWRRHAVWRNRMLGAGALGYPLPETPPDYGLSAPLSGDRLTEPACLLFHATSRASKLWPAGHWVALGRALQRRGFATLLPSGNEREQAAATGIAQAIGAGARVLPRTGIRELAGVIAQARMAVGVDTGLLHLAAALGRPTVGIFCDSDPAQTGVLANAAMNLGGFKACPAADEVLAALEQLGTLRAA
ncbi:lipopolysaccharide heptosyltransferase I [Acidiphilium sp.]|uniref:lipopolysaccharide heptosyltransferase I n=1 Tax=Acidiphilium sp. TaxID=527 RepID=UPI00258E87D4|nr:lipopolysaccharide heptosyltransferase I [Acidiphilium sp.]